LKNNANFTRVEKILDYIHNNIREPLSLEDIAAKSCWSRWQLQRVFQDHTGFSVAQYVKEIKLSQTAERVLSGEQRMLDIALEFGFSSEVSFSRSFKQFFGLSPKRYQKNGLKKGIMTPLSPPENATALPPFPEGALYQVRLDHKSDFKFSGIANKVKGLRSATPDFSTSVPAAWQRFFSLVDIKEFATVPHIGLIQESDSAEPGELIYWSGVESTAQITNISSIECFTVPECTWAVLPFQGDADDYHKAILWMLAHWLPESGFKGIDGAYEMEIYYPSSKDCKNNLNAEYWLAICE